MKGIIIYEDYRGKEVVEAIKLDTVNYKCTSDDDWISELSGIRKESTQAWCNKDDTYDFETGALIALMKMCGCDKVVRACNEAFSYEKDLHELRKENNNLREANKGLQEEVKRLKGESESHWKKYQRNIQKKQDRINELNNIEEEYIKLRKEYDSLFEENEKLQHEYDLCKNSENALKCSVDYLKKTIAKLNTAIYGYKNDLYKVTKRCEELEIKESMLNKQEETNNKKEEKLSLTVDSLIEQSRAFTRKCVDEWLNKPPTKREEMWNEIFESHKESDVIIEVKKEDVNTFLHEIEDKFPEIIWASGVKIFETKYTIKDVYFELKTCDTIYFRLRKETKLSYTSDPYIYPYRELKLIDYLPPMRWDLFKKGRIVVKVNHHNYEDFYNKCEIEIGRKPHYTCKGTFTVCYSKGVFHTRPYKDDIPFAKKIVNWEDVR